MYLKYENEMKSINKSEPIRKMNIHIRDAIDVNIDVDHDMMPYYRSHTTEINDMLTAVGISKHESKQIVERISMSDDVKFVSTAEQQLSGKEDISDIEYSDINNDTVYHSNHSNQNDIENNRSVFSRYGCRASFDDYIELTLRSCDVINMNKNKNKEERELLHSTKFNQLPHTPAQTMYMDDDNDKKLTCDVATQTESNKVTITSPFTQSFSWIHRFTKYLKKVHRPRTI